MNYRERRGAYLNCEKRMFNGIGQFEIPELRPVQVDLTSPKVIGFNYAIGERHPEDKIVHFFLDDYQFERVWNDPDRYLPVLNKFKAVLAPDFSMYTDFPFPVQLFNWYRRQWCGAYWQENGITVIPTVCWGDENSFSWCFDGIPQQSLVCISTVGGFRSKATREAWFKGYYKCLETLDPSEILFFGKYFPDIQFDGPMTVVDNSNITNKATKSEKPIRSTKGGNEIWEGEVPVAE